MVRMAGVYSGSKWQHDLFTEEKYKPFFDEIIHACKLPSTPLSSVDVLIVPRESNQEMLLAAKDKIIRFLDSGGLVISFGEVTLPWLPNCVWEGNYPRFRYDCENLWSKGELDSEPYTLVRPEHPLFFGLTMDDLQWHFHGLFHAPPDADVLLTYGDAGEIIYLDSKSFDGKILATTLDPDVHFGYGVVKKTQKFLDNILRWAVDSDSER